eukprot:gnl/MRDRNA2_/MRDRNA2_97015_c0_seq1.p1 gnl/MRDRNA2_/MRDRNA2_97015_c0~~gnl/MRDRNA2_/MRDRNA2_97015_c0_seq1.p1  ORF type:complete len:367 (+),score=59.80 gnl/MRDRNA2_/MRDRNA2_97015_c0_seq1:107-1207(+)
MRDNIWDCELVQSFAFHPRTTLPEGNRQQGFIDGSLTVEQGIDLAYRLFVDDKSDGPAADNVDSSELKSIEGKAGSYRHGADTIENMLTPRGRTSSIGSNSTPTKSPASDSPISEISHLSRPQGCVIFHFHGNGEMCTGLSSIIQWYYRAGAKAVFCAEFRGYAWSTGTPRLDKLNPDAEAFAEALPEILREQRLGGLPIILSGRSLGATCAVHLAAAFPHCYAGLILDSALTDIRKVPLIREVGWMMPGITEELVKSPDPLQTLVKLRKVIIPTLMLHGEDDNIIPVAQAKAAILACGAEEKRLRRFEGCGHNNLKKLHMREYFKNVRSLCAHAIGWRKWRRLTDGHFDEGPESLPESDEVCPVL